jgi:hypothetical protein
MSRATRPVEGAPWGGAEWPQRMRLWAGVCAVSAAAIVGLMTLAAGAGGATESLGNDRPVSTPSIFAPVSTRRWL